MNKKLKTEKKENSTELKKKTTQRQRFITTIKSVPEYTHIHP